MDTATSEILGQLSSSGWWFSTILVAVIVNIISSFIYDSIKKWVERDVGIKILWVLTVTHSILTFTSSIVFQTEDYYLNHMLPLLGFLLAVIGLIEPYWMKPETVVRLISFSAVLGVVIFLDGYAWPSVASFTLRWFFYEYWYALLISVFVTALAQMIVRYKLLRAQRRYRP